jgi:uncharacterized protein YciI
MRILCLAVLAAASMAHAQDARSYFLIEYEVAAGVEIAHLSPPQIEMARQHAARLAKLRDEGIVIVGGRTANLQHPRGIVIVTAKDEAGARALAGADPAVRGGLMRTTVEAFELAVPPR